MGVFALVTNARRGAPPLLTISQRTQHVLVAALQRRDQINCEETWAGAQSTSIALCLKPGPAFSKLDAQNNIKATIISRRAKGRYAILGQKKHPSL